MFEFWHPNVLYEFDSVISKGLVTDEPNMFDGCEVELDMGKWLWGLVSRAKADNYKKWNFNYNSYINFIILKYYYNY